LRYKSPVFFFFWGDIVDNVLELAYNFAYLTKIEGFVMDMRKIKKLIDLVKESGVGEIEVKSGEESVRISLSSSAAPQVMAAPMPYAAPGAAAAPTLIEAAQPVAHTHTDGHTVPSPMVGTVYLASTPGEKPFVEVGQHVSVGDTICIIEAMKMFNPIEADISGVISARMIENGEPVEFDQALYVITPDN
jgi:acetyl-CoA carboxylase biotin carboxyl carrier protein